MSTLKEVSRRRFLELTGAAGSAALAAGYLGRGRALAEKPEVPAPRSGEPAVADFKPWREAGRVIQVTDERAMLGLHKYPQPEPVKAMVARAVCTLTGKKTPEEAWAALVEPHEVIGLKPNGLGGRLNATSKELIDAVIAGLLSIGVKPGNIVVWEQFDRYLRNLRLEARNAPSLVRHVFYMDEDRNGEFGPEIKHGAGSSRFCKVLHEVSAVINLPVFKDHGLTGVTCCLKNMTHGTVHNPRDFHNRNSGELAHIYAAPVIASKVRLNLADALRVQFDGGPRDTPRKALHHSLYASTDPVAIDALALKLIDELRREKRFPSLAKAGRAATHVETAQELKLGVAELDKIKVERVGAA